MKKTITIALVIMLAVASILSANGTQEDGTYGNGRGNGNGAGMGRNGGGPAYRENFIDELAAVYDEAPGSGVLSKTEKDGLLFMIEEEKLARDVYRKLYEEWNLPIFRNIADSEQQHMEAIGMMLDVYDVAAPEELSTAGVFRDRELQQLYAVLVEQGSDSVEEALTIGAAVEDLDISDLQKLLGSAENDEVKILFQNLMKGSRNHIRSFTAQLERFGKDYTPSYISSEYYEKILKYNREMSPISDPEYSI